MRPARGPVPCVPGDATHREPCGRGTKGVRHGTISHAQLNRSPLSPSMISAATPAWVSHGRARQRSRSGEHQGGNHETQDHPGDGPLSGRSLSIGAAPALAADGCDCHTAVPPTNGAPAAHALLVASVTDCTTCHVGMAVPHTGQPTVAIIWMRAGQIDAGYRLHGQVYDILMLGRSVQRADVTVYLQQRGPGETAFVDIGRRPPTVWATLASR